MVARTPQRVGLALGGGAARGWAHIGVIRALAEAGIHPDVVCGTSIGALVGAAYAHGDLEWLESWVSGLTWRHVVRLLDLRITGGLIGGNKLIDFFNARFGERQIAELRLPYVAVATELNSGREVWLQDGRVMDAVRASIAIPGLFTPVLRDGIWLVDGGLCNPVPVSVARAMRADIVIAVDLNHDLLNGRDVRDPIDHMDGLAELVDADGEDEPALEAGEDRFARLKGALRARRSRAAKKALHAAPSMIAAVAQGIDIMQVRITRSRMAGEPADIHICPKLGGMSIFDFHRAIPAIEEGRAAVARMMPAIESHLALPRRPVRT